MVKDPYLWWLHQHYRYGEQDELVRFFLKTPSTGEWLKKARQGLFLPTARISNRLEVTRAIYLGYEKSEASGTIALGTLREAAEAMDCELVYAIRPKTRQPYSRVIWDKLFPAIVDHVQVRFASEARKHFVIAGMAGLKMQNPKFRRLQGWGKNPTSQCAEI